MSPHPDDDSRRAGRREFIDAYLSDLDERVQFTDELFRMGRRQEALLLCCCYIDGLGRGLYYGSPGGSHRKFVRIVSELGGLEFLGLIHPRKLMIALNSSRDASHQEIRILLDPLLRGTELVTETDFLTRAQPLLMTAQLTKLGSVAWKGTMASLAYGDLRSPVVHALRGPDGISFDRTTYRGQPVPMIDFRVLRQALANILPVVRQRFVDAGTWP